MLAKSISKDTKLNITMEGKQEYQGNLKESPFKKINL